MGAILPPGDTWECLETFLGCRHWEKPGILPNSLQFTQYPPIEKNDPAPNVNSVAAEKSSCSFFLNNFPDGKLSSCETTQSLESYVKNLLVKWKQNL